MTEEDILAILSSTLEKRPTLLDRPSLNAWSSLEEHFKTILPKEFKIFIELMAEYDFPGDIYNVTSQGSTNKNDTIIDIHEAEMTNAGWPMRMIPFYGIGNGDYFALNANEHELTSVYYLDHETRCFSKYCNSFSEWIQGLPDFLNGS